MNVLLLYPEMPQTFWSMKHLLKITGKKSCYPPLSLLTIAAMLPKDWNKRLIDLNVHKLVIKDLKKVDYVFISAMNVQELSVRQILKQCSDAGIKVVAGGPLFTHEYEYFDNVITLF